MTRWSQDSRNEHNSVASLSSSSYFTSILENWQIRVLKTFKWSTIFVPSFIHKMYNRLFKKILFFKDFVIYKISSLFHKLVVVSSPTMLNNTSSARHKWIVLRALASRSSQSSSVMLVGFFVLSSNAFCNPCCIRISRILSFHSSKLFLSLNFSTSNLELYTFAISTNHLETTTYIWIPKIFN